MMRNSIQKSLFYLVLLGISAASSGTESERRNQFQYFDNNITAAYQQTYIQNHSNSSEIGLNGVVLFDNNLWFNAEADSLLTYSLVNNNRGLQSLYQNKSGSSIGLEGGYAFINNDFNFIPHLGFNYTNLLIAYNQNSIQQFIFENPIYTIQLGINNEYIIIDKVLKFGLDLNLGYSLHKAVVPNNPNTLGHIDYDNYIFSLTPLIQYNITNSLVLEGYYTFATTFASSANPPNVYYPAINVNSSNIIDNSDIVNIFGIRFGILF